MDVETESLEVLLYAQDNHISSQIECGQEVEALCFVPFDPRRERWKLTSKMMEYVESAGLKHLPHLKKCKIDHALLNALVERWRPETNTFHFVSGERTITLQDISYIYGLPIDGKAVIGKVWYDKCKLSEICSRLLGVKVDKAAYLRGGQLSLNWILDKFSHLPEEITAYDEIRYARAYLFFLVASQICTNNSGARGHAYLLELFEEFERYAWGPACLACIYRSMTRATQIKDRLRTITGPVQLIQIWAYSHTAVGHHLRAKLVDVCFEFPLFKMWQRILEDHSFSHTNIEARRKELSQTGNDQTVWQPYQYYAHQLDAIVDHRDKKIYHTTAPLMYYWIIERHNADRVYRQFGLIQPVPLPFHRLQRSDERASKSESNYGSRNKIFVDAWEARDMASIVGVAAQSDDDHRGVHCANIRLQSALKKVDQFLRWQVQSIRSITRYDRADDSHHITKMIESKTQEFRKAIKSIEALEKFDLGECINNGMDSSSSSGISRPRPNKENFESKITSKVDRQQDADMPTVFIPNKKRSSSECITPLTDKRKHKSKKGCEEAKTLPHPVSPYPSEPIKGDLHPNAEYILSADEQTLLAEFWEKVQTRPDALSGPCSYIAAKELYQILGMHWISTTVMDYWLQIIAGHLPGTCIFPSMLANWRDRGWSQAPAEAFGVCQPDHLEQFRILIFPVWYSSHFFLIAAYPNAQRWEYYSTIGWRKRHWEYASQFRTYVCAEFENRGWLGFADWEMENVENCPRQGNSNDCGVFVMAIANHLARGRPLTFSQSNMWYFR